jgi:NADH:ubiquinone oxidoreductase subunit
VIPILGGIQPGILNQFYTEENKDNGFIDRILTCYPDLDVEEYNDNEMDEGLLQWYEDFIIDMYQRVKRHIVVYDNDNEITSIIATFSTKAQEEWKRIFNEITVMQNSPMENEYMKSMLPKQKSYIPRFALLINTLDTMTGQHDYDVNYITRESLLKAERLSRYFINMAKKVKMQSSETFEIKKVMNVNKLKSKKDQVQEMFKANPEFNRSQMADLLGISRQTIQNYINEIK